MPHQCTSCGRTFEDGSKEMLSGCPDCGGNKFQFMPAGAVNGTDGGGTAAGATSTATAPKKTPESARSSGDDRGLSAPETGGTGRRTGSGGRKAQGGGGKAGDDDCRSAVNRAAATVRDWVRSRGDDPGTDDSVTDAPAKGSAEDALGSGTSGTDSTRNDPVPGTPPDSGRPAEDSAQASARRDVVSEAELPDDPPRNVPPAEPTDSTGTDDGLGDGNVVSVPEDENPGLQELREELNSQFESIRIVEPGQYELNLMELYEREEYIIALQEDGKYVIEVPDAWDATED